MGKRGREGDRPGGPIIFLLSLRLYEPYETDIFATLLKMILIVQKDRFFQNIAKLMTPAGGGRTKEEGQC